MDSLVRKILSLTEREKLVQIFVLNICLFRGALRSCDIPYWTAEKILEYASELEKVIKIFF